jgi:phage/plasmid-like protein (TIGR03299 family)
MNFATNGLDWEVIEAALSASVGDQIITLPGQKGLFRSDNHKLLSVMSDAYEVVPNSLLKEMIQPLVEEGLLEIANIGWLQKGKKVFIQTRMAETFRVVGENHQGMLTILNSHDGTTLLSAGVSAVRVICSNTFAMAYSHLSTRLKHDLGVKEKALGITETLDYVNTRMAQYNEAAELLALTPASDRMVEGLFLHAYNKQENEKPRNWDQLWELYRKGQGNEGKNLWEAVNAITEWSSHSSKKSEEARFAYNNVGTGATVARRAIDYALELV